MLDDGFSLKSKHVARNKTDINLFVVDSLYFPLYCFIYHNRMSLIKILYILMFTEGFNGSLKEFFYHSDSWKHSGIQSGVIAHINCKKKKMHINMNKMHDAEVHNI